MPTQYIINFTDPERDPFIVQPFTTNGPVAPNTLALNSSAVAANTGLLLFGKGHPNYGERTDENLIHIMENFSGATEPTFPISGQTWFSRITYVVLEQGPGSPGDTTIDVYKWSDSLSGWEQLTDTGGSDPTAANEVKVGTQPASVVDGAYWLEVTSGSPFQAKLSIGVNNSSSNLGPTWLEREFEDLSTVFTEINKSAPTNDTELNDFGYEPQKQLKVYDGLRWKNAGNVFSSEIPPQNPTDGDMWFNTAINEAGSPSFGSPLSEGFANQLFIWESGQWRTTGYVSTGGDTLTGTLAFGLPTSSLFLWEGQGNDNVGPDLRATGNALLTSGADFYIHINDDSPGSPKTPSSVFEVAAGSQSRGTHTSLFQVRSDGLILSALGGSPYQALLTSEDNDAALVNWGFASDLEARITVNENNIETLAGSPPDLEAKVNRSGDTMTGTLNLITSSGLPGINVTFGSPQGTGSPLFGEIGIDAGNLLISNLQDPIAPQDAVNLRSLTGSPSLLAGAADGVVDSISTDWDAETLTVTRTQGLSDLVTGLTHDHPASEILYTVNTLYLRDTFQDANPFGSPTIFGSPLLFGSPHPFGSPVTGSPYVVTLPVTQEQINTTILEDLHSRTAVLEAPSDREVFFAGVGSPLGTGGSPTNNLTLFTLTEESYIAGTNRLQIFVNGVKQYVNERAYQKITFNPDDVSPSFITRLPVTGTFDTFELHVIVDGGSPEQIMTAPGNALTTFQHIIDEINLQIMGVTAVWSYRDKAIVLYSDTTGTGSSINVIEGVGSPNNDLLSQLANTFVGSPTTSVYTLGNISPTAGGPISTVFRDLAYREVNTGSPTIDAFYSEETSTIQFNTLLTPGDAVEIIATPAFEVS